nr:unnamed protein product [Callosobruchus chinensis]
MRGIRFYQSIKIITEKLFVYSKRKKCHTTRFLCPLKETNIHAVIRGIPAFFSEQEIREELEQKAYSPHHLIRLKRSSSVPMHLAVVILSKSQQVFKEHEPLGLAIRVEV